MKRGRAIAVIRVKESLLLGENSILSPTRPQIPYHQLLSPQCWRVPRGSRRGRKNSDWVREMRRQCVCRESILSGEKKLLPTARWFPAPLPSVAVTTVQKGPPRVNIGEREFNTLAYRPHLLLPLLHHQMLSPRCRWVPRGLRWLSKEGQRGATSIATLSQAFDLSCRAVPSQWLNRTLRRKHKRMSARGEITIGLVALRGLQPCDVI